MTVQEENGVITYNPMAILHLFNNAISLQETKKLIKIKGIYVPGKGANYSGYFYDSLRDESSDASITLLIPSLIRNKLNPNKTITFNGFITRRVVNNGGRIELQVRFQVDGFVEKCPPATFLLPLVKLGCKLL